MAVLIRVLLSWLSIHITLWYLLVVGVDHCCCGGLDTIAAVLAHHSWCVVIIACCQSAAVVVVMIRLLLLCNVAPRSHCVAIGSVVNIIAVVAVLT